MPWKTKEARQQHDAAHREQQRESNRKQRASETPEAKAARLAYNRAYYREHRKEHLIAQRKSRAKFGPQARSTEALRGKYGLTPADVERMFADQAGLCASCMDEISLTLGAENYRHVDHDHTKVKGSPGFIRGLLCSGCNQGAGNLHDSPDRCRKLAAYLEGR
jgi:hypothetical protein